MKTVQLGHSGLHVPAICLGTMTFGEQVDEATAHTILDRAVERGITFMDTAEMYSVPPRAETFNATEIIMGNWLAARAIGLDVGAMSGFDNAKLDAAFFAGTAFKSNFLLNIGYGATKNLNIGNDGITFQARFGGVAREISVPIGNVAAIYARENGAGMAFEPEGEAAGGDSIDATRLEDGSTVGDQEAPPEPPTPPAVGRPKLQRIK